MPERRTSPRVELSLGCRLSRRAGSAIAARTIDVGPEGMCISCGRPLRIDEVLDFELPPGSDPPVTGQARVMRQQTYGVYAMRFERLDPGEQGRLRDLTERHERRQRPG